MTNNRVSSRKWFLVQLVFWLTTLITVAPPLISIWVFKSKTPLVIINGTEFVSLITLIVSAYFGINVWQKQIEFKNGVVYGGTTTPTRTTINTNRSNIIEERPALEIQPNDDIGKEI